MPPKAPSSMAKNAFKPKLLRMRQPRQLINITTPRKGDSYSYALLTLPAKALPALSPVSQDKFVCNCAGKTANPCYSSSASQSAPPTLHLTDLLSATDDYGNGVYLTAEGLIVKVSGDREEDVLSVLREAITYEELRSVQGSLVPYLYGLYQLRTESNKTESFQLIGMRQVHGLLMVLEDVGICLEEETGSGEWEGVDEDIRKDVFVLLEELARHGYEHHDVRPANFCRKRDGSLAIIDLEGVCTIKYGEEMMFMRYRLVLFRSERKKVNNSSEAVAKEEVATSARGWGRWTSWLPFSGF